MGAHPHTADVRHHDHQHHYERYVSKYLGSQDHKMIG